MQRQWRDEARWHDENEQCHRSSRRELSRSPNDESHKTAAPSVFLEQLQFLTKSQCAKKEKRGRTESGSNDHRKDTVEQSSDGTASAEESQDASLASLDPLDFGFYDGPAAAEPAAAPAAAAPEPDRVIDLGE